MDEKVYYNKNISSKTDIWEGYFQIFDDNEWKDIIPPDFKTVSLICKNFGFQSGTIIEIKSVSEKNSIIKLNCSDDNSTNLDECNSEFQ